MKPHPISTLNSICARLATTLRDQGLSFRTFVARVLFLACAAAGMLAPMSVHAAIGRVQTLSLPANGAGTTTSATFAASPAIGDTVVIFIWSWGGNSVSFPISASDSYGNVYTTVQQAATPALSGVNGYNDAAVLSTIVTATGANFTITAKTARDGTGSSWPGLSEIGAVAVEYTGLAGVDKYSVTPAATGGVGSPATLSLGSATSKANELVTAIISIVWPAVDFASITPTGTPNAWVQRGVYTNNANFAAGEMADQVLASSSTPSITWTPGSTAFQYWTAVMVAYQPDLNCTSVAPGGSWSAPATWTSCNSSVPQAGATSMSLAANTKDFIAGLQKGDPHLKAEKSLAATVGGKQALRTRITTQTSYTQEPAQVVYLYTVSRDAGLWYLVLAIQPSQLSAFDPIVKRMVASVQFPN